MGKSLRVTVLMLLGYCHLVAAEPVLDPSIVYREGETAVDATAAARSFNQALELYQSLAADHISSDLFYNIGNCYFQLGEYPWAVLYYERARALRPRNRRIAAQLDKALIRAGLQHSPKAEPWMARALGARWISLRERVWLSVICGLLAFVVGSIALWSCSRRLYRVSVSLTSIALLLMGTVFLLSYGLAPQAILVKGSLLRCDAGHHYAPVQAEPLLGGSRVAIQLLDPDQAWAEVKLSNGQRGFIPTENLHVL